MLDLWQEGKEKFPKHTLRFKQTISMRKHWRVKSQLQSKIQKKIIEFYRTRAGQLHCHLAINLSCFHTLKKQNRDERTTPVQDGPAALQKHVRALNPNQFSAGSITGRGPQSHLTMLMSVLQLEFSLTIAMVRKWLFPAENLDTPLQLCPQRTKPCVLHTLHHTALGYMSDRLDSFEGIDTDLGNSQITLSIK